MGWGCRGATIWLEGYKPAAKGQPDEEQTITCEKKKNGNKNKKVSQVP